MSEQAIQLRTTSAPKRIAVGIAAYMAAQAHGLSPIQCEAVRRSAWQDYEQGSSPARAVANAWAQARQLTKGASK